MYKVIWWGFGHSSQQINVSAHIAVWYAIAAIVFDAKPLSEKVSRTAFLLYIFFLQLASAHHLLVEPGLSSEYKIFNTSYGMYLAVLGSMIHGLTVPGCIEAAQRKKGFNKGLFEWLRKAPWGNPVFSGMFLSLILFGFLGGISGVTMGVEQINIIIHNTIYVPGHFHGTVAVGTTLAFMAITYFLVPTLFRRALILPGVARWQPYVFGIGMGLASLFMMGAGTLGVSRRHWDMAFSDAALHFSYPAAAYLMMGLTGICGVIAAIGGAMFIIVVVGSLLFGEKLPMTAPAAPAAAPTAMAKPVLASHGDAEGFTVPGTFSLAILFLVSFVLYYFVNWKYLASTWGLS
jgi:cytochrome c oxidase subunit 1